MNAILKKLRLKFMLTTTGIVALLIAIVATGFCISVYTSAKTEIDLSLDHAVNASVAATQKEGQPSPQDRNAGLLPGFDPPQGQSPDQQNQPQPDQGGADFPRGDFGKNQIDLFRGKNALVYSVVLDGSGDVIRTDSPAIEISDDVLASAVSSVMSSPSFKLEEGNTTSGKLPAEQLYYEAKVQGGDVYLALTDSTSLDDRLNESIIASCLLAAVALLLTVFVSIFLARLSMRPVEDAWNKQRRFIADASHELKTPLTVIMANTEIVRSDPGSSVKEQMKWLDSTMDESERMQGLIADLLLLARMDDEAAAKEAGAAEDVDFSEAVENTLMSFEAIAFERKLVFEESVEEGIAVKAVRSRIVRLPDILVDNACKYAEANGTVEVALKHVGDKAVLRVFNTGQEIAEKDLEHLFDRFYRADESRSDDIPGYGLGLSIARSIAEEAGGEIQVENVPGKGVAFTVTLPIAR